MNKKNIGNKEKGIKDERNRYVTLNGYEKTIEHMEKHEAVKQEGIMMPWTCTKEKCRES